MNGYQQDRRLVKILILPKDELNEGLIEVLNSPFKHYEYNKEIDDPLLWYCGSYNSQGDGPVVLVQGRSCSDGEWMWIAIKPGGVNFLEDTTEIVSSDNYNEATNTIKRCKEKRLPSLTELLQRQKILKSTQIR